MSTAAAAIATRTPRAPRGAHAADKAVSNDGQSAPLPIDTPDGYEAILRASGLLKPSYVHAQTRGVMVLFPYAPKERKAGVTYPFMKGHLETKDANIPVSAFLQTSEEGRMFLSLSIGGAGYETVGGALFRSEIQSEDDGTWSLLPGKERERFGSIAKTVKAGTEYETVFELRTFGKLKKSALGVPYIRATVYAERMQPRDDEFQDSEQVF